MPWQFALSGAVVAFSLWELSLVCKRLYDRRDTHANYQLDEGDRLGKDCLGEDRISELPDEILHLIVSHLSLRDAFKLKTLSNRWRCLGVLRRDLILDTSTVCGAHKYIWKCNRCVERLPLFVRGVNQILNHHIGPSFTSLTVDFCLGSKYSSDVDRWIKFAGGNGVERLELRCGCFVKDVFDVSRHKMMYTFSTQLLSGASRLKHLYLHGCKLKANYDGQYHFLTVLDLNWVVLSQYAVDYILLRCPNLEKLRLHRCFCPSKLTIDGPFLQLKFFTLELWEGTYEVELSAPKLTTFEYQGPVVSISFTKVPNLKNVYFAVPQNHWNHSYILDKISMGVPHVRCLSIGGSVHMHHASPFLPTFKNVMQLDFYLIVKKSKSLLGIIPLLRSCPLLQKLRVMTRTFIEHGDDETTYDESIVLHKSYHTQLKQVEIGGFYGGKTQMALVMYILENAVVLEQLSLTSHFKMYCLFGEWYEKRSACMSEEELQSVAEQLRGKAASRRAEVILESYPLSLK